MINSFSDKHAFLSNFYVERDGTSVEVEYQAAKCIDLTEAMRFKGLSPSAAKKLGRRISLRPDWDSVKLQVMRSLVERKFNDHEKLRNLLMETGDQELVEGNWWGDVYWGVCRGVGENHLGKILMDVRAGLRTGTKEVL